MDCLFCQIARKEVPAEIIHEDEFCVAFNDINPAAPVHFLVIPKKHIVSVADITAEDEAVLGHMLKTIAILANDKGLNERGYRVVSNIGEDGQQTIPHLHFHVIGGRSMTWPPG
ncbi:HIT family hydrolase [Clostridiaceae bacterium JG1575]|nr:HIT family hydrolase [Clostridiaceae bacterium JG1575]